jgi:hypothetical protein
MKRIHGAYEMHALSGKVVRLAMFDRREMFGGDNFNSSMLKISCELYGIKVGMLYARRNGFLIRLV